MIRWHVLVAERLKEISPPGEASALVEMVKGSISRATVYNFLSGKPIKSDLLAIILEAVGLEVVPKKGTDPTDIDFEDWGKPQSH